MINNIFTLKTLLDLEQTEAACHRHYDRKIYKLGIHSDSETGLLASSAELWHLRLAHIQPSSIIEMAKSKTVQRLEISSSNKNNNACSSCVLGKAHRSSIPNESQYSSTQILELVHSDVNGPLEVQSLGGSGYFVTFRDDFSRWTSVLTMRNKSDTFSCFKLFRSQAGKHTGAKLKSLNVIKRSAKSAEELKILRTDHGGEYVSNELSPIFKSMAFYTSSP